MKKVKSVVFFLCLIASSMVYAQSSGTLSAWQEGYLDIHQISTGRGNAAFIVMPDGTTMLLDAGDLGDAAKLKQDIMPQVPNASKRPAEWIVEYIRHFSPQAENTVLDYALLTHFHDDHIGSDDVLAVTVADRPYKLTGISHVAELMTINKLVDRGWPDYNYPTREKLLQYSGTSFENYEKFIRYQSNLGLPIEGFQAGSNEQFKLLKSPNKYTDFEIRNIYVNGKIWTGSGSSIRSLFPLLADKDPSENRCSCALKLTYGKFNYFSGGDISGSIGGSQPEWLDVETPVGEVVGKVEVMVANHHAYSDAMIPSIIASLQPQAFILPVWDFYHPQPNTLERMFSKALYPGERAVFAAGMLQSNRERLGELGQQIKPAGHVVVRVYPKGDEFQIFVLNDRSTDYEIIYQTDKLHSK